MGNTRSKVFFFEHVTRLPVDRETLKLVRTVHGLIRWLLNPFNSMALQPISFDVPTSQGMLRAIQGWFLSSRWQVLPASALHALPPVRC